MTTMSKRRIVWCVKHKSGWCATYRGRKPDPEAWSDKTRCGYYVILRSDSARREPTCLECRVEMGLPEENPNEHAEAETGKE